MPDSNANQPSLCFGFAAATTLRTAWGPCRVHDLAHLTRKRDQSVLDHQRTSQTRTSQHAWSRQQIERARDEACASLKVIDTSPLEAAFALALEQHDNVFETEQAQADQLAAVDVGNMLPPCFVNVDAATVLLVGVFASEASVAFVDVTIGVQLVAGPDNSEVEVPVKVRCTPDVLFATLNGYTRADMLVGENIRRVNQDGTPDTYVVPDVVPVLLDTPAPVYGVDVGAAATACIGSSSAFSAVVRTTL